MCIGGAPKVSDNGAAEARAREEARQAKIRSGMGSIDQARKVGFGFMHIHGVVRLIHGELMQQWPTQA